MFEKLPVSIPIIDNLGFPSFLTKQVIVSFAINAGAKFPRDKALADVVRLHRLRMVA